MIFCLVRKFQLPRASEHTPSYSFVLATHVDRERRPRSSHIVEHSSQTGVNDVEYDVKHRGDHFFIEIRDKDRPNSEVLVAPVADPTNTKVASSIHMQLSAFPLSLVLLMFHSQSLA